ncbi:MAG: hypothetical protein Q4G26_14785 [Paracoccus sp. (in: a-proteobacteria)]|nr:hypothetical protein [Paracoccus sp. (in: a-proteobacteria)]
MTDQLPATVAKLPPLTALDASLMQPHEIVRHRTEIAVVVEVVMSSYWREDMPDAKAAAIIADWCDELEDWPVDAIRAAMRKHRRNEPNRKPNPGHILAILKDSYGRHVQHETRKAIAMRNPQEDPRERVTPEQCRAILDEFKIRDPIKAAAKRDQENNAKQPETHEKT